MHLLLMYLVTMSLLYITDPAVINRESELPPSTNTTNVVGIGRHPSPVPIPHGNNVSIYCPYSGLDDPTNRTQFFAVDSNGNLVPSDQLPSPKYSIEQQNSTLVLTISNYSPDDMYHTFVCNTMNQAGRDSQRITLVGKDFLSRHLLLCVRNFI